MLPGPKVVELAVYRYSPFKIQADDRNEQKHLQGDPKVLTMLMDQSHRATRKYSAPITYLVSAMARNKP